MPLSLGSRLGHYEILASIGAGGMGEVYKARDTRLNRLAALKVLPTGKMSDPDRRARFIHEAQTTSALNHPHIVTIYGIDRDADIDFIAMEYVQGRTLDQVIGRRGLKLQDTLRIGIEIADALTAAHAAGVVHRDLKPANVIVADSGVVKVLDFGLAKLIEFSASPADEATRTIRADAPVTEKGTILGTVSYMSPEQAEGKAVESRSDVFSFGSVLYEMATGRRAFQGDSKMSTISAILRDEPKPVNEVRGEAIPRDLEKIILRCLRKDVARRFQHMDDVKVALEELKEESESGKLTPLAAATSQKRSAFFWIPVALAVVIGAGVLFWRSRPSEMPAAGPVLTRLTSDAGLTMQPAFWAQGSLVAYASDRDGGNLEIYVQQLGGEPHRITSHEADSHEPDISPDGTKIVFRSESEGGGIYLVPTLGGTERKIANRGRYPRFSPDGNWIVYWDGEPGALQEFLGKVYVQALSGGGPREVAERATPAIWSPDSKHLLYGSLARTGKASGPPTTFEWFIVPTENAGALRTGLSDIITAQKFTFATPYAWTSDGITFQAVSAESQNLWRVTISSAFKVKPPARQLTFGTSMDMQAVVSGNRMLFTEMTENADIWTIPMDTNKSRRLGEPQQITHALTQDTQCSISADGTKLVHSSWRGSALDLIMTELAGGKAMSLASSLKPGRMRNYIARITNDGALVAFQTQPREGISVVPSTGGLVKKVCDDCYLRGWANNGRRLLIDNLALLDPETGQKQPLLEQKQIGSWTAYFSSPRTSWDDRWIAFYKFSMDGGRAQIWVAPVHPGRASDASEWIPVTDGNTADIIPEFSPDGSRLYFFSQRDGGRCIWVQRLDPVTKKPVGAPEPVHHFHSARRSPIYNRSGQNALSVARNKIALEITERLANIWMAEVPR